MDCGTLSRELAGSELFGHVKVLLQAHLLIRPAISNSQMAAPCSSTKWPTFLMKYKRHCCGYCRKRNLNGLAAQRKQILMCALSLLPTKTCRMHFKKGKFREDLYHRLNEFMINLPPLRERKNDIPLFADFFLQKQMPNSVKISRASTTTYWMPLSITPGPVTYGSSGM